MPERTLELSQVEENERDFLSQVRDLGQNAMGRIHESIDWLGTKGIDALETVSQGLRENKKKTVAAIAVGSTAVGGGLGMNILSTASAYAATGKSAQACVKYNPNTLTPSAVEKAILPLASNAIKFYQHTKPTEKSEVKTRELYENSYRSVKQIDAYIPAQLANSHNRGTYILIADFAGRIIPKDMVAIETEESSEVLTTSNNLVPPTTYNFLLDKSTTDGPSNPVGLHWSTDLHYNYGSGLLGYYSMDSRLANGGEVEPSYSMTASFLKADSQQAVGMLEQADKGLSIRPLKDLAALQKPIEMCS